MTTEDLPDMSCNLNINNVFVNIQYSTFSVFPSRIARNRCVLQNTVGEDTRSHGQRGADRPNMLADYLPCNFIYSCETALAGCYTDSMAKSCQSMWACRSQLRWWSKASQGFRRKKNSLSKLIAHKVQFPLFLKNIAPKSQVISANLLNWSTNFLFFYYFFYRAIVYFTSMTITPISASIVCSVFDVVSRIYSMIGAYFGKAA